MPSSHWIHRLSLPTTPSMSSQRGLTGGRYEPTEDPMSGQYQRVVTSTLESDGRRRFGRCSSRTGAPLRSPEMAKLTLTRLNIVDQFSQASSVLDLQAALAVVAVGADNREVMKLRAGCDCHRLILYRVLLVISRHPDVLCGPMRSLRLR
jgi:hypothetical protein